MNAEQLRSIANKAIELARKEIETYGLPHPVAFDLSLEKGQFLAESLGANSTIVDIGVAMMDFKLGQAFKEKRLAEHVKMSAEAAKAFLKEHNVPENISRIVINAAEAHHGGIPFVSVESEICANADCYRFIHPKGVFLYLTVLGKRLDDFNACLLQVESKLDEKMKIVSLPIVRDELMPIYNTLKNYIALSL